VGTGGPFPGGKVR